MNNPSMVNLAEEYLDYRRALGSQLRIEGRELLRFARWADASGHTGPLTIDLALRWASQAKICSRLYQARRLEVVRGFARHRALFDPCTEIPLARLLGPAHCRTTPYIYSPRQILQLLDAAMRMTPPDGLRPRTYHTLFGLLACTGLRISEALKLTRSDVDLAQGVVTVTESKFRKSRLVPLDPSATESLLQYAQFRDRYHPDIPIPAFFLSESGRPLAYSTVRTHFRRMCRSFDWPVASSTRQPRMHDLRHTFVCQRILQWHQEGVNVEHAIASLSTYLGHRKVSDTYWYLTGIPELMGIAASRFEQFAQQHSGGAQ